MINPNSSPNSNNVVRTISLSSTFLNDYRYNMSPDEQQAVRHFLQNYYVNGFGISPLCGKNKSSADVVDERKAVFARINQLFHYHIGLPYYSNPNAPCGQRTSRDVLSYTKQCSTTIKLIKLHAHPPFYLPTENELQGEFIPPNK